MNASTVAALNRINRRFYDRYSDHFSATRSRAWPGWSRAVAPFLDHCSAESRTSAARAILDVGCGNGRFAVFMDSVSADPYWYLGLDDSIEMLELAQRRLRVIDSLDAHFQHYDISDPEDSLDLTGRRCDLVVVVGVLHHVPGIHRRRRLLESLASLLAPGGIMILSFWQFGREERFHRRVLSWSDHNRVSCETVDEGDLEGGDFLLAWGTESPESAEEDRLGARRYCHYADGAEAEELTRSLDLSTVDQFESDGRTGNLNLYRVLKAGSEA